MQRIGDLSMEVELLRSRIERPPFGPQEVAVMAAINIPEHRPPLRHRPGLPHLGRAAIVLLCRPAPGRHDDVSSSAASRTEARGVR